MRLLKFASGPWTLDYLTSSSSLDEVEGSVFIFSGWEFLPILLLLSFFPHRRLDGKQGLQPHELPFVLYPLAMVDSKTGDPTGYFLF